MGDADDVRFWIEQICLVPAGPKRGARVKLTIEERALITAAYGGGEQDVPITGALAAYLALFHVCGPAAKDPERYCRPPFAADIFSVLAAAGPRARAVIRREGGAIICPELGTRYPSLAA
jgi:hypothetical protein